MIELVATIAAGVAAGASEQAAFDALLDRIEPAFGTASGERDGALLVVTDDAGSATAVRFWRDALAVGPALASPAAFPWCLANAACGALARRFRIVGANVTWLADEAPAGLAAAAGWWVDRLRCVPDAERDAWIVALRFAPQPRAVVWHWRAAPDLGAATPQDAARSAAAIAARMAPGAEWTAAAA